MIHLASDEMFNDGDYMITTSAAAAVTSQESPVSDVKEFGGTKSRKKFESGCIWTIYGHV